MATKEKIKEVVSPTEDHGKFNEIVLFNDDVNTFDHVIQTLVDACNHTFEQAEQCSLLVHCKNRAIRRLKATLLKIITSGLKCRNNLNYSVEGQT
jgi:ATP-dependent Clp protease adapter protein ClpS